MARSRVSRSFVLANTLIFVLQSLNAASPPTASALPPAESVGADAGDDLLAQEPGSVTATRSAHSAPILDPDVPTEREEVPAMRTIDSRTYLDPNGSYLTQYFPAPVHYETADAGLQPIEAVPVISKAAGAAFETKAGPVLARLGDSSAGELLTIEAGQHSITFEPTLPSVAAGAARAADRSPIIDDDGNVTYPDVYPGIDLRYTLLYNGAKEDIILTEPGALHRFAFSIDAPGLTAALNDDGSIDVGNDEGTVFHIPAPFMVDSTPEGDGDGVRSTDVAYQLATVAGRQVLVVSADKEWLADPERVYPVYIDPTTVTEQIGTTDTFISSAYPSTSLNAQWNPGEGGYYELWNGYYDSSSGTNYAFVKTGFPAGRSVTSATFHAYVQHAYSLATPTSIYLGRLTSGFTESQTWNMTDPGYVALTSTSVADNQWANFNVTSTVQSWSQGTATNHGFRLYQSSTSQSLWKRIRARENGSSLSVDKPPYLTVIWTNPVATPLSPTGSAWTTSSALDWSYSANGSSFSQTKFHAQVSTSSTTWSGTPLKADSGEVSSSATAWTAPTTNLVNGTTYYWRVKVYDGHSWSSWTAPAAFRRDTAAASFVSATPEGAITAADPNFYDLGNGTFTIKVRGSDAHSGIKLTYLRLYNATDEMRVFHDWSSATTTNCTEFNTSAFVDATACSRTYNSAGIREVQFTVVGLNQSAELDVQWYFTDFAGNVIGYGDSGKNLIFDATPPTGSITNPAAGATVGGNITISGTASDANFKHYELHYGVGGSPTTWTAIGTNPRTTQVTNGTLGTWTTTGFASGTYTIRLRVFDQARVTAGFTEALVPVNVDNAVPTATISAPAAGAFVAGSVPITGTAAASSGFASYALHYGVGCSPSSWLDLGTNPRTASVTNGTLGTWNTGSLQGPHAIRLVVTKTSGLTNTAIVCVTVDNAAPSAIIGSPAAGEVVNGSVSIIGQATDPNFTGYELHFGAGASPTAWTAIGTNPHTTAVTDGLLGTWNASGLSGTYTLRLRVFDPTHTTSGFAEVKRTVTVGDAVTLAVPALLRSTGADLRWSLYDGTAAFGAYEIHRSTAAGFAPSAATRIATLGEQARTSWQDTSARPGIAFSYRIVVNGLISNEQRVTLPAAGQAVLTLQPGPADGRAARIYSGSHGCFNNGAEPSSSLGSDAAGARRGLFWFDLRAVPSGATVSAATFSYVYQPTSASVGTVNLHQLLADWEEGSGTGQCNGSGTTWKDADASVPWDAAGGDIASAASASVPAASRTTGGTDAYAVTALVQRWLDGASPNHGFLVKLASEPATSGNHFTFATDDYGLDPAKRPKLVITYTEPGATTLPHAAVSQPAAGTTVRGPVTFGASASDDSGVTSVLFMVDGVSVGTDSTAPYSVTWSSTGVANGSHALTVRATDNAGNTRTSAAVSVVVDNTAAPTVTLTAPAAGTVSGSAAMTATASDDLAVARVDFLFDDYLIASDSVAPYAATWNTLNPVLSAFDGAHTLTARAYDAGGQVTISSPVAVTVANRSGPYRATIAASSDVPAFVFEDDEARARTEARPALRALLDAPIDSEPGATARSTTCNPTGSLTTSGMPGTRIDLSVTNDSPDAWPNGSYDLWYRWFSATGEVVFEGAVDQGFGRINAGAAKTVSATVHSPALCGADQLSQYRLRFDIWDPAAGVWFAEQGNAPVDRPVAVGKELQVAKNLSDALGLERYYQYWGTDVGAGMGHMLNLANGNSILRWTPLSSPGRGLSTVVDLTYNSLEDHSDSPVGNNWSLAISSLTRLGGRLDIHPNNADNLAGNANRWIAFTDGDGTTHRFEGSVVNGTGVWDEPPGVNLYLRDHAAAEGLTGAAAIERKWALTRPDGVTFYYRDDGGSPNNDGYPTAVSDRNGNELTFTLEAVPPGDDPGGNHFRVTAVTDAGGRAFSVDYYTKAEAHKPQIRGKVQSIADHTGSRISFEYFDDGNLRRLTQAGGTNADGSVLADRSFVFSYTTPNGSGPAITDAALRYAADAKTTQSTRLYSVFDPLRAADSVARHETTFSYVGPGAGTGLTRWMLSGVTDRANQTTAFAYDLANRLTTVTAPLSRVTRYAYDTDGKVTSITDPTNRVTSVAWSDDFQVTSVDEPGQGLQQFTYNVNGYLTDRKVKTGVDGGGSNVFSHTRLVYEHLPADSNDVAGKWEPNRGIEHISQLISKVDPNGMSGGNATGTHDWTFDYDSRGNLTLLIDPEANQSVFTYSATDGTLLTARDANGHFAKYESHDANGFPQIIHEGLTSLTATPLRSTRFAYDADGLLLSVQDPNHFALGSMTRANSAFFDYDAFHRLGRQSAPKSTDLEPGQLIWSAASYDANDNLVRQIGPHFGSGYTGLGAPTETAYDSMDRPTLVTGPDTTVDPAGERTAFTYDAAGRLTKVTAPKGVASGAIADDFSVLYTYDPLDRIARQTRHEYSGSTISRSLYTHACYDANDDLTRVTAPNAGIPSVTCTDAPPTHTTLFEYDAAHRQTATIDPEGHRTQTAYDRSGNVLTTKDALGRDTAVEFDQRNLPLQVTQPLILAAGPDVPAHNVVTRIEYDAVGNRSALISPRAFDAAAGSTTYDDYVTTYLYDALNRPVRTDLPTDADFPQQQFVHSIFDANGNMTWNSLPTLSATPPTTDAERKAGGTVVEHWDPGWIASSDSPDATPAVHFDYSAEGWQAMRAPELLSGELNTGEQMFWSYFSDGMLRQRNDRGGQSTTYEYDANNNLTEAVDAAGVTAATRTPLEVLSAYDTLDRILNVRQRELPKPSQPQTDYTVTRYLHDPNGNVTDRFDNGTQAHGSSTPTDGPRQRYIYDEADWVTTQFDYGEAGWEDDQRIRNTFFATGWEQTRIVERATSSTAFTPKQTTEWDYFANGKLAELTISDDAGATVQHHNVEYLDAAGNYLNGHRTLDTFTLLGPDGTAPCRATACAQTYHYDPRDRLISQNDGKGTTIDYSLDLVGNIAEEQTSGAGTATTTYAYLGNQLQTVTDDTGIQRHFYDPNGNLACVTVAAGDAGDCPLSSGATPSNQVLAAYRYDYLDRLASYRSFTITGSSAALNDSSDYDHDALDRVAAQTESHVVDGSSEQRHTVMNYLGLTALVSGEQHFAGSTPAAPELTTKAYSYDAWGHRIALSDDETLLGSGGSTNPAAESYTYAYDVHGSVSLLLDESSTATASYGYRPYGGADDELTAGDFDPSNETEAGEREHDPLNAFRYSGRRLDTGSGSIDMGARRYGPDTGRFLQRDFLSTALGDLGLGLDPLTQGRYNFAGGNPISFVETDGHLFLLNGGGSGGSTNPPPEEPAQESDPIADLGEGIIGVGESVGSAFEGAGRTLQCVAQFSCVADAAVATGSGVAEGVGTFAGDPLGTTGGIFSNAAKGIGQAHANLTSSDPKIRGRQVGDIFVGVFGVGLGGKALSGGSASGGRLTGGQLAVAGLAAENRVSAAIGVARNVGSGRATIPGSGPGGFRVPDFDPATTIATRGTVVEVKDVAQLSSTAQLRDLMAYAQSRNAQLEIFSNAPLPSSGDLFDWYQSRDLILNSIP